MNKNLGASAGVLALIAFAVHLVTGPSSDKRPGGESPQPAREEKDKSPAPAGQAGSERESAIEGPCARYSNLLSSRIRRCAVSLGCFCV